MVFTSCGSSEQPVKTPADNPITWVQFMSIALQIFRHVKVLNAIHLILLFQKHFMRTLLLLSTLAIVFSCKSGWTQKDTQDFMGGCMKGAVNEMGAARAQSYCSCMLDKLQKKYPNAADLKYVKNDTAIYLMGKDCLK